MDGSETDNGVRDGEEGYRLAYTYRNCKTVFRIYSLSSYHVDIITTRELYNKLDDEHREEEKEGGKSVVCKKHLGLSLRAINENIDENPEVGHSCIRDASHFQNSKFPPIIFGKLYCGFCDKIVT